MTGANSKGHGRAPNQVKWFLVSLVSIVFTVITVVVSLMGKPGDQAVIQKCDEAVGMLLSSKDVAEVTRAGILIRELRCDVQRRLPR